MARTANKLKLSRTNYHSTDAEKHYMSVSQFKNFMECEARAMAELEGKYKHPSTNAMLVGSYVHAAFESKEAFEMFQEENNGAIFKARGGKYADFEMADQMIETIKNDDFAMFALDGEKEQIFTAYLWGTDWKIKVDSINHDRKTFADIKTTQDLHKRYWSDKYGTYVTFVEVYDYVFQMAIYRRVLKEATGEWYTPYIVAVTKENPPNKAVLHFDRTRFDFEYEYAEAMIDRILKVKKGEEPPERCERCEYCRATKKLDKTIEIGELLNG
jgi:hypothetical protein